MYRGVHAWCAHGAWVQRFSILDKRFDLADAVFLFQWQSACCISWKPLAMPMLWFCAADSKFEFPNTYKLNKTHSIDKSKNRALQRESNARSPQWNALLARRVLARSDVHRTRERGREGLSRWNEAPCVLPVPVYLPVLVRIIVLWVLVEIK